MLNIEQIRSSIEGSGFISNLYFFDELDSTNTYAADKSVPADSLIITGYQTSGKGRFDRKWESAKDVNLTFSIKKKLPLSPSENHFAVCFFSYYVYEAICQELRESLPTDEISKLFIKWPNDIMFVNKKISGILIESKLPANEYIIGIGINCNQNEFKSDINAASLSGITGRSIDMNKLLLRIIEYFSTNFYELLSKKFDTIFEKWKNSANILGKTCIISSGDDSINNGKIIDLNMDGSITIQVGTELSKFYSGEIRLTGLG